MKNVVLSRWIFTEAQTGKTRLGTHYSFLNKKIQAYVEDENVILVEYYIVKDISFSGGIPGTTAVLVDAKKIFGKRALNKNKFKIRTGARETYELCWHKDSVEATKSSNVSVPEIIPLNYANNDLYVEKIQNLVSQVSTLVEGSRI